MSPENLKYIAETTLVDLRDHVGENLQRYVSGDFLDLSQNNGWSIDLSVMVDLELITQLDPSNSPEAEIRNSMAVWKALGKLTPSLASEERMWVRLTHLEGLKFARERWLADNKDSETTIEAIERHFFANTLTKRRDDNALSRLWWNAYIAKLILPDEQELALGALLKRADIRSNLVERRLTVSRLPLAAGIVRLMQSEPWISQDEINFREFMKLVNKFGGGRLFEIMEPAKVDAFFADCSKGAQKIVATLGAT